MLLYWYTDFQLRWNVLNYFKNVIYWACALHFFLNENLLLLPIRNIYFLNEISITQAFWKMIWL